MSFGCMLNERLKKKKEPTFIYIKLFLVNILELTVACNIEMRKMEKYLWHLALGWTNHINSTLLL